MQKMRIKKTSEYIPLQLIHPQKDLLIFDPCQWSQNQIYLYRLRIDKRYQNKQTERIINRLLKKNLDLIKLSLMTKKNLLQWFFRINHLK